MTPEQRAASRRLLSSLPVKTHLMFTSAPDRKRGMDKVPCEVEGIAYPSLKHAARDHSVSPSTIKRWIAKGSYGAQFITKESTLLTTEQIINAIPTNSEISAKQMALAIGVPEKHLYARLSQIRLEDHHITRTGSRRHYRYRREHTPDIAADSNNPVT